MANNNASNMLMLCFLTACAATLVGWYLLLKEEGSSSENNLLSQDDSGHSILSHDSNDNFFSCSGKGGAVVTIPYLSPFFDDLIHIVGSSNGCGALSRLLVCKGGSGPLKYLEIYKKSTKNHIRNVGRYLTKKFSAEEGGTVTCHQAFSAKTPDGTLFATSVEELEQCV